MRWADIKAETTVQAQDAVSSIMFENGCGGIVIQGDTPIVVQCYLPVDDRLEQRMLCIRDSIRNLSSFGLDTGSGEITVSYAEEAEWAEAWKAFFKIKRVGKRVVIKPTWEEYEPKSGDVIVEIDPGMAFGTGEHQTTEMCLELLERYIKPRQRVIDFGTGSGVLAIAAAKLRSSLVIAFDSDELAVRAARNNVIQNGLEERIEIHQADNPEFLNLEVDIVLANLVAETVISFADALVGLLKTGGVLITSGIVVERSLEVEQSLRNAGFDVSETQTRDEWVAIVARRR